MGLVAIPEGEAGREVAGEELLLLDVGQKGLVNGLLVSSAGAGNLLLLFGQSRTLVYISPNAPPDNTAPLS